MIDSKKIIFGLEGFAIVGGVKRHSQGDSNPKRYNPFPGWFLGMDKHFVVTRYGEINSKLERVSQSIKLTEIEPMEYWYSIWHNPVKFFPANNECYWTAEVKSRIRGLSSLPLELWELWTKETVERIREAMIQLGF